MGATEVGSLAESEVVCCVEVSDVPGMMKGPRMLDGADDGASDVGAEDEVPERTTSGNVPVGAACWFELEGAWVG